MKIFKQGETYEEDINLSEEDGPVKDVQTEKEINNDEKIKQICKYILIGCIIIVVILVITKMSGSNKNKQASNQSTDTVSTAEEGAVEADINAALYAVGDTSAGSIGTTIQVAEYSDVEAIELRKWGYTADEIEFSKINNIPYDTLIERAKRQHEEAAKESLKAVSDTASDEYKALLNSTFLGNEDIEFEEVTADETGNINITYETVIENVDYVKVGSKYPQLFVKLLSDKYGNIFMTLSPDRWLQLKESGNIVIQFTVMNYGDNSFVTDVSEITEGIVQSKY